MRGRAADYSLSLQDLIALFIAEVQTGDSETDVLAA